MSVGFALFLFNIPPPPPLKALPTYAERGLNYTKTNIALIDP